MSFRQQFVDLVLRAKDQMSSVTDRSAASVKKLADTAEGLQEQLRALEDQKTLISQFSKAEKTVDRASTAYDRAKLRLDKLTDSLDQTGPPTERQAKEFELAQKAVDKAEREYEQAGKTMAVLAKEAKAAGIDITDLNGAQRENAKQVTAARRAMQDYNKQVDDGDSRLQRFNKSLSGGVARLLAWGAAAGAAGAALAVTALTRFTAGQADLARQTIATSQALDISTTKLQEWQYAARSMGLEGDKTADIMKDVAEKIGEAFTSGTGEAAEVLDLLNLSAERLIKLRPDEQLLAIAERIQGLPKPQQVQILEAMASDASLLLPLLEKNAEGLKRLGDQARKRGSILSEEELKRLTEANEAFNRIITRIDGLKKKIAGELAPTLTELADDFDEFLSNNPKLVEDIASSLKGLITATKRWVDGVLENREGLVATFDTITSAVGTLTSSLEFVFRVMQTGVSTIVAIGTNGAAQLSKFTELAVKGLNKVGLASDNAVRGAESTTNNLRAATEDLIAKTTDYGRAAGKAFGDALESGAQVIEASQRSGAAMAQAAKDAVALATGTAQAGSEAEKAAGNVEKLASTQQGLAQQIAATVEAIEAASQAWRDDPSDENLARLQELRAKYAELQESLANLEIPPVEGTKHLKEDLDEITSKAKQASSAVQETGSEFSELGDKVSEAGDAAERTGQQAQESADTAGSAIADIFTGWSNRLASLSDGAAQAFQRALGNRGIAATTDELSSRLEDVNRQISNLRNSVGQYGLARAMGDLAEKGLAVERQFLGQAIAAEKLTESIQNGERTMGLLNLTADQVKARFDLLDDTRLSNLQGAIQSVQREVQSLKESLDDTIASARQELAALQGDTVEVERLRHQERQLELQEQLNRARQVGDREAIAKAQEALQLAEQAHRIRMEQAREQAEADRQRAAEQAAYDEQRRQQDEREERQDISRTESRTQAQTNQLGGSTRVVQVQFSAPDGREVGSLNAFDDAATERFLQALENGQLLAPR